MNEFVKQLLLKYAAQLAGLAAAFLASRFQLVIDPAELTLVLMGVFGLVYGLVKQIIEKRRK